MNEIVSRLAREMADAIAAAVAGDPRVSACRSRARAEGYALQLSIEAVIGFAPHAPADAVAEQGSSPREALDITPHDRRFLRSLRIAVDQTIEEVE
jgi:hypothetical protein